MNYKMIVGFLIVSLLLSLTDLQGATVTWTGTAGTADNSWYTEDNWDLGVVPDQTSDVKFNYTTTVKKWCKLEGEEGFCKTLFFLLHNSLNRLDLETTLTVGDSLRFYGTGALNVGTNGVLRIGGSAHFGGYNSSSAAATTQRGSVSIGGSMDIGNGNFHVAVYNANGGTLSVTGNVTLATGQNSLAGGGKLSINGADVNVGTYLFNGHGASSPFGANGTVELNAGSLYVKTYFQNAWGSSSASGKAYGTLNVVGGDLEVGGDFKNGNPTQSTDIKSRTYPELSICGSNSTFQVHGSFSSIPNARFIAKLAGPDHTPLQVDGNVALDGTFVVTTNGVYRPRGGESWEIIVADADGGGGNQISGTFATVDLSAVEQFGDWKLKVTDNATRLVLYLPAKGTVIVLK